MRVTRRERVPVQNSKAMLMLAQPGDHRVRSEMRVSILIEISKVANNDTTLSAPSPVFYHNECQQRLFYLLHCTASDTCALHVNRHTTRSQSLHCSKGVSTTCLSSQEWKNESTTQILKMRPIAAKIPSSQHSKLQLGMWNLTFNVVQSSLRVVHPINQLLFQ